MDLDLEYLLSSLFLAYQRLIFELTIVTGEGNWRAAERLQVTGHFWKPGPRMTVRSRYVMYKPPGYRGSPPIEENNKPFLFPLGV